MIHLSSPQQLRYLVALAECQHFGRAALPCACAGAAVAPVAQDEFLVALPEGHPLAAHRRVLDEFAATSPHTLVAMVAGGLGVTLLPRLAVAAGLVTGTSIVAAPARRPGSPREADYAALAPLLSGVCASVLAIDP